METRTRTVSIALCLAMASSAPSAAAHGEEADLMSEYTVTVSGVCPGRITLEWSVATPHRWQGILTSRYRGQWRIPVGQCRGTVLGLDERVTLMKIIPTGEGSGSVSATGSFGGTCRADVQLVEGVSCNTSNVALLP